MLAFNGYFVSYVMDVIARYQALNFGVSGFVKSEIDKDLLKYVLIMFGVGLFAVAGNFIQKFSIGKIGQKISAKLKQDLFKKILQKQAVFFNDPANNPGTLTQRLSTDCDKAQQILSESTAAMFQGFGSFVAGIVLSMISDWRIGLIGLASSPIILANGLLHSTVSNEKDSASKEEKDQDVPRNKKIIQSDVSIFAESITNMITILTLNTQDSILARFK